MNTLLIHHAGCPDGLMAAAVALRAIRLRDPAADVDVLPAAYNRPLESIVSPERAASAAAVYLLDFSLPPADLDRLAAQVPPGAKIVVLDHHKSAVERFTTTFVTEKRVEDRLAYVEFGVEIGEDRVIHAGVFWRRWSPPAPVDLQLDLAHSGAALAWLHFHPGEPLPQLVAHVEDYDLWRHALPDSRAVHAYLRSIGEDAEAYAALLGEEGRRSLCGDSVCGVSPMDEWTAEGRAILRANAVQARHMAGAAEEVAIDGVPALAACAPVLQDDVGEILYNEAKSGLAAVWCRRKGKWKVSLRSMPKGGAQVDCAEMAMRRGGGGHKSSASFECDELPWAWPRRVEP